MRGPCLLLLSLAAVACVSAGQSRPDYYKARQPIECQNEEACRSLLEDINFELPKMAEDDAFVVRQVRAKVQRKLEWFTSERERVKEGDRKRTQDAMEAAAKREQDRVRAEREAQYQRDKAESDARYEAAKTREKAQHWLVTEVHRCREGIGEEHCAPVEGLTTVDDVTACHDRCDKQIALQTETAQRMALQSCVGRYVDEVEAGRKGTFDCTPDASLRGAKRVDNAKCLAECKVEGPQRVADRRPSRPGRRGGGSQPAQSGGGGGDTHVMCCDGTRSPTCTTVHRGCCSHHGGVC